MKRSWMMLESTKRMAILFALMAALLTGCSGERYRAQFDVADSLCYTNPDSARQMLARMKQEMAKASKADQMHHALLSIKADDKLYLPLPKSDSIFLAIIDYYEHHRDKRLLPEAYFYAGRFYMEKHDEPQALEYFNKAAEVADKNNLHLVSLANYSMGYIYFDQSLYEYAIEKYKIAYAGDSIHRDTISMAYDLRDLALSYRSVNRDLQAIECLSKAYNMVKSSNDDILKEGLLVYLASSYDALGDYEKAMECLAKTDSLVVNVKGYRGSKHQVYANIFLKKNMLDSAKVHLNMIGDDGTLFVLEAAHKKLAEIAYLQRDYDEMYRQVALYKKYNDSVLATTATEAVAKMKALYDYSHQNDERLKAEHRMRIMLYFLVGGLVVLIYVIILLFKNKQKRIDLEENLSKLKLLQQEQTANADKQERDSRGFRQLYSSEIYEKLKKIAANPLRKDTITFRDWNLFDGEVNESFVGFRIKLSQFLKKMSTHDYRICLLIKAGFSPSEIANIMGRSTNSIANSRKRLYEKTFGKGSGGSKDWDEFIFSL